MSRLHMSIDWERALLYFSGHTTLHNDLEQVHDGNIRKWMVGVEKAIHSQQRQGTYLPSSSIVHLVIMATYREDVAILRYSISNILASRFDLKKVFFILAGEERDKERAMQNGSILQREFGDRFGAFYTTVHPHNTEGEVPGKGSNITFAAKVIVPQFLRSNGFDPSHVLVTTLDADNCVHPLYFANLTVQYLMAEHRGEKSYQPLPLFYNNIWDVPMFNRMVAFGSSFWHMIESGRPDRLRNFSSHAQSLDALLRTDFWSSQTIVEDGHQYWRSYFIFRGQYGVIPLFIPIYQDAVQSETYTKTLWSQYKQLRRWAWGCSDIPYVLRKMRELKNEIPLWNRLVHLTRLIEGHYMWATAPIVVTLTLPVPRMINEHFANTVVSYNMGITLSHFFSIAMIGVFLAIWISLLMAPPIPHTDKKKYWWLRISSIFQWFLLPVTTILFGAIPAIEAQTRLMLGSTLDFQVTEKIRVSSHSYEANTPHH